MKATDLIDNDQLRDDVPDFAPGDEVKVHACRRGQQGVHPGNRGNVIARQGGGLQETYTVRKLSYGVGVERTSRCTHRRSRSRSSSAATSAGRSSTTCVAAPARPPRSRKAYFLIVRPFWRSSSSASAPHADRRQEVRGRTHRVRAARRSLRRGGTSAMDLRSWRGTGAVGSGDRSHPATRPHACGRRGQGQEVWPQCRTRRHAYQAATAASAGRGVAGRASLVAECQSASTSWQSPAMTSTCTKTF